MSPRSVAAWLLLLLVPGAALAASKPMGAAGGAAAPESLFASGTFTGLALRGIGPAVTSGRVVDIAVNPQNKARWFVASASGGVWKTNNAGATWEPVFDSEASYSIGCVTMDPKNPLTVWVGSGENNSQRSVSYGDGVYKSVDGGKSWTNMGLKSSEHIGMIAVDPRNPDRVFVAAQGPLWSEGGERGLYLTTDGGKSWTRVLHVDDNTGVSEVRMDPRDPDVMYAVAYERHRRVWTLIDGGPGSGLWKSTDGGRNWKKLTNGLPKEEIGRIGLAISPANPDVVYAIVEAAGKASGVYRSTDAGGNWEKMGDYVSTSPQYYQELVADPKAVDRVYSLDTFLQVSTDGGKTWRHAGEKYKHVDNHFLWIDPADSDHLIGGCDGGVYESWDRAATWQFKANLPVTQFYKVSADNSVPFYRVCGGTQDNNTISGPSRTTNIHGGRNSDWVVTMGGDGFSSQVDPEDPNLIYSEAQDGDLARYDLKSGEDIGIQPQPEPGEAPSRWDWDAPLLISPHSHTRLYFASQRVYRSDDRGDTWRAVSPDLTAQIDRNKLKVAGRVWSVDAVAKSASTSFYGNIVALSESPKQEGLLYVGTDDGVIQVTEDGGAHWRKIDRFPGVPPLAYVSKVMASEHEPSVVYAAFDNHKMGDFKPYVLKSDDRGRTWTAITGNLPARGTVYCLAQDPVDRNLIFAGTEFGLFFTIEGGHRWAQLKGGMPTIQVRDLVIQKREGDLVAATFGRGFYILDDLTPLRGLTTAALGREAALCPVRPALMYVPASPMGGREKASQGDAFYTASNPPFGATFTYYVKRELKTLKKSRQDREKAILKKGGDVYYPSWDSLKVEDREEEPAILLTVTDAAGKVVRRLTGPVTSGYHRVAWDLRYPASDPPRLREEERAPWDEGPRGPLAAPGSYTVAMAKRVDGKITPLGEPQTFTAVPLANTTTPAKDRPALVATQEKIARLQRAVLGAVEAAHEAQSHLTLLRKALQDTPGASPALAERARALDAQLLDLLVSLTGDPVKASRNEPTPPSIRARVERMVEDQWASTSDITGTNRRAYEIAGTQFTTALATLRTLVDSDLAKLEADAESAGAPWTPGRVPEWKPE